MVGMWVVEDCRWKSVQILNFVGFGKVLPCVVVLYSVVMFHVY